MNPTVSVIVPTRNRAKLLPRAINSILAQSFKDFEIIIIDGNSTDDTQKVVEDYNDPRIRYYLQEVPKNGAQATNEGIAKAKGKYIAFLDDDDVWLPEKLEKQVSLFESLPEEYGMVYCWMDYFNGEGQIINQTHPTLSGYIFKQVLLKGSLGGTPTFIVRKEVVEKLGGFDINLKFFDDSEFVRRVAKYYKIDLVPEVLTKVYVDHGFERQSDDFIDAVNSSKYLYKKYKDDFKLYPNVKSQYLTDIAYYYSINKNVTGFLKYSFLSFFAYPFGFGKYKTLLKAVNYFFKK